MRMPTSAVNTAVDFSRVLSRSLGHIFNAAGSITDTVTSTTGGCDTIRTINVTTIPLLTATVNTAVCENAFPATILGHIFNAAGYVTDTVTSTTGGCDTIITSNETTITLLTATVNTAVCENAFPATILGHIFNAAGQVIDTVSSTTGGCDTIRTINVTTIPLLTATVNTAVCENAFPATILGHIFNAAGQVIDTVTSTTGGCDTIRTINVTTIPLLTATVNTAVCENAFPATILGHIFNAAGSITDTVTSTTGGCDTIRTINVTTIPLLTATVNTAVCENAFPSMIRGQIFNAVFPFTDMLTSTTGGCDTIRTINVTTIPLLTATVNTAVCENAFPATILGHIFNAAGSITDTVTSTTGGCDTIRTINVTTIPLLTATVNTTVCENAFPATILGHIFNAAGFFLKIRPTPRSTLFPYTTLIRSTIPLLTATVNTAVCENAFPATILGHIFNAAGSITDTVTSTTGGCDTIRTINVTTIPLLTATVNTAVCQNAFPATLLGHIFNAVVSITVSVSSKTGEFDTIRTIHVSTLPLLTATVNTAVCENAFPATILGHIFNAAGSITDTVTSTTGGCDTIRTINVTTIPLLKETVNTALCENEFPATII